MFDLLSRAEAGLSRSAALLFSSCHGFVAFRCADVPRNRYESVPVVMMCAWSVSRSISALHSRGLGITCDHSDYWLRVSGFAGPETVSDHRKTRDRCVDAMIM